METMTVHIDLWGMLVWLVGLLIAFFGCIWAFAKVLGRQQEKLLDTRFASLEASRSNGVAHWDGRFSDLDSEIEKLGDELATTISRVTAVESSRQGLLSRHDLDAVFQRLNGISREVSELTGALDGIRENSAHAAEALGKVNAMERTLELINRHLLDK
jgi:hypothetical protein